MKKKIRKRSKTIRDHSPTNPKDAGSKAKRPELCIAKVKMKKTIILPQVKKWFKKVQKRVSTATWWEQIFKRGARR